MTKIEEKIMKFGGALMIAGLGWMVTIQQDSNRIAHTNQVALAETKAITIQTQKDVLTLRKELGVSRNEISKISNRVTAVEVAIEHMGNEK